MPQPWDHTQFGCINIMRETADDALCANAHAFIMSF